MSQSGSNSTSGISSVGSLVKISTQVASSSSSIVFTSGISSEYRNYFMVCDNVSVSGSGVSVEIQLSSNGGSSYISTGYLSGYLQTEYNSSSSTNGNTTSGLIIGNFSSGSTGAGNIYIYNLTTTSTISSTGGFTFYNGSSTFSDITQGTYNTATAMNALQVTVSSGTFSGNFTLYGIVG